MSAFTPGPWATKNERWVVSTCGKHEGEILIAPTYWMESNQAEAAANARLIAAGPDLYEALRWFAIRQDAIQALFDLHGAKDTADAMRENFKAARAALSKVKG